VDATVLLQRNARLRAALISQHLSLTSAIIFNLFNPTHSFLFNMLYPLLALFLCNILSVLGQETQAACTDTYVTSVVGIDEPITTCTSATNVQPNLEGPWWTPRYVQFIPTKSPSDSSSARRYPPTSVPSASPPLEPTAAPGATYDSEKAKLDPSEGPTTPSTTTLRTIIRPNPDVSLLIPYV
jgi:hypothetical protein